MAANSTDRETFEQAIERCLMDGTTAKALQVIAADFDEASDGCIEAITVRQGADGLDTLVARVADLTASLNRASDACASVQRERDEWKGALIDELIVAHIYTKEHEYDPKRALADAITWNVRVAMDPAASSDAAALIDRGRQEVLRDAVELARFAWDHYPNPDTNHVDYRVEVARKAKAFLSRYEGEVK